MSEELAIVGARLLAEFKAQVGSAWEGWTPEQRSIVESAAVDYALIMARALAGNDVKIERGHVEAQLANIKVAAAANAVNVFHGVIHSLLRTARTLLLEAVPAAGALAAAANELLGSGHEPDDSGPGESHEPSDEDVEAEGGSG